MRSSVFYGRPLIFYWRWLRHVLWASCNRHVARGARPHISQPGADGMGHVLPHYTGCWRRSTRGQRPRGHTARGGTPASLWLYPKTPQKAAEEMSVAWEAGSPGVAHGQGLLWVGRLGPQGIGRGAATLQQAGTAYRATSADRRWAKRPEVSTKRGGSLPRRNGQRVGPIPVTQEGQAPQVCACRVCGGRCGGQRNRAQVTRRWDAQARAKQAFPRHRHHGEP
jgi:hypothetical protein